MFQKIVPLTAQIVYVNYGIMLTKVCRARINYLKLPRFLHYPLTVAIFPPLIVQNSLLPMIINPSLQAFPGHLLQRLDDASYDCPPRSAPSARPAWTNGFRLLPIFNSFDLHQLKVLKLKNHHVILTADATIFIDKWRNQKKKVVGAVSRSLG